MSSFFCKYKNIAGEPGKGIHSYRIMDVAILDVIGTIIIAFIISYFSGYSFPLVLGVLFFSGIFLHRLFCVRTTIDKLLFTNVTD